MKKRMILIIVLALCSVGYATETEPTIKVGQIWEYKVSGDKLEVFEVGEKYVVYGYTNGGDRYYPSVKTRKNRWEEENRMTMKQQLLMK